MAIEVFNRVEKKYIVERETYRRIIEEIEPYMNYDPYCVGGRLYTISNIYYDTPSNDYIRRSLEQPYYKEKLRLRSYGVPREDSKVYLEIKKKFKGSVNKRRTALMYGEATEFLKSGKMPPLMPYMNRQVLRELEYFINKQELEAAVYLAYDRLAFFGREDSSLRISFDNNIRTRRSDLELASGDYGRLLIGGRIVMEIKAHGSYPMWLVEILDRYQIRRQSFSKYGKEFEQFTKQNYDYRKFIGIV